MRSGHEYSVDNSAPASKVELTNSRGKKARTFALSLLCDCLSIFHSNLSDKNWSWNFEKLLSSKIMCSFAVDSLPVQDWGIRLFQVMPRFATAPRLRTSLRVGHRWAMGGTSCRHGRGWRTLQPRRDLWRERCTNSFEWMHRRLSNLGGSWINASDKII